MRQARFWMLLIVALAASGCARQVAYAPYPGVDATSYGRGGPYYPAPSYPQQQVAQAEPVLQIDNVPYGLDAGDKLRVVVFGQDGLSNTYSVDAGGSITMPLIGAVQARGRSTTQLAAAISEKLKQGYIREPHVAVEIETYRPFFILGEVTFPGQYPYVANMTVETAVAIAGGYTPRAQRKSVDLTRPYNGQILRGKVPPVTPVRPGDTIVVGERWF